MSGDNEGLLSRRDQGHGAARSQSGQPGGVSGHLPAGSDETAVETFRDLFGVRMSQGTIMDTTARCADTCRGFTEPGAAM